MRYRLMATYLGIPYHAGLGPDGNEATLFSPSPPPDDLGFTAAGGHWRKQPYVERDENGEKYVVRRQIYIAPYIKGPEGKPLILKRRAFELVR